MKYKTIEEKPLKSQFYQLMKELCKNIVNRNRFKKEENLTITTARFKTATLNQTCMQILAIKLEYAHLASYI